MKIYTIIGLAIAAFILAMMSLFTVREWEQALILRFGEPVRVVNQWDGNPKGSDAGLKYKWPWESVVMLDRRNLDLDFDPVIIRDVNLNPLSVDAFVRYRITDPVQYYKRFKTKDRLRVSFKPVVEASLRDSLGKVDTQTIVAGKRAELMTEIQNAANNAAEEQFYGIEVIDVRIKRADYPPAVAQSVFNRMAADRQEKAALLRQSGKEEGRKIENDARRRARIIVAEAREEAARTKGEGDAERTRIFAEAHNLDPEFYEFYRSMEAYEKGLMRSTNFVMSPNSDEFLSYLDSQRGNRR